MYTFIIMATSQRDNELEKQFDNLLLCPCLSKLTLFDFISKNTLHIAIGIFAQEYNHKMPC